MALIYCPKCDFPNDTTSVACTRCGRSLDGKRGRAPEQNQSTGPASPMQFGPPRAPWKLDETKAALLLIVAMLTVGSILYRLLVLERLEQTSALFIGIPSVLAALAVLAPKARSTIGVTLKGITICLLMSGILLGEGFICIIMAAPLFYLVGILIAVAADYAVKRAKARQRRVLCLVILAFLPQSLEGVSKRLSFNRRETVQVDRLAEASASEIERALDKAPEFNRTLPFYLRLGFPRPVQAEGRGLAVGDRRIITFAGGEGVPGQLVLEVSDHRPGMISFRAVSDTSHISHWLDWNEATVNWEEIAPGKTRIRWTLIFTRRLDPAWYFAPWERYAAGLAAGYLIDTVATPRRR